MDIKSKIMSMLAASIIVSISVATANVEASSPAPPIVYMNGQQVQFDVQPRIIDGRTYVPFRHILESLGAEVKWDPGKQIASATKDGLTVLIPLGSKTISMQGHNLTMDVPVIMIEDRNLVPLRFVAQALGASVEWQPSEIGDKIQMKQNYQVMIDQLVTGQSGDQKVTYEQAAILFDWLLKGQEKGQLPAFTGNDVPAGKEWHYQYDWRTLLDYRSDLQETYPDLEIIEKEFIKTGIYRIQKHDWTGGGKVLFQGYAVWDTTRAGHKYSPTYSGTEVARYLPNL